ncbi:MAG: DinB family protein [Candidatus Acidiferrum sp.]
MQPLSPVPIQGPISMLEKMPALLELLLRDVPGEALEWKPAAERWSIAEVLGHLVMIEKLYGQRARRIVLETSPTLPKYDAGSEENAAKKSGRHAELGVITLSEMLHELANHDLGHLRQIAELYRAYSFYPHAGPYQKYSNLKP